MPSPNHHIILRQVFELEFPAGEDGFALQQEIGRIVREKLLPRIEALFDRFAAVDELIRIDKLELDIGRIPPADLEETLMRSVLKQLEEKLEIAVINQPPGVVRLPAAENHFEHWLFFLENGYLPEQAAKVPEAMFQTAILEQLASETLAVERFRRLLQKHPAAIVRLVRQHAYAFLVHVLETLTARSQRKLPEFLKEMQQWQHAARAIPKGAASFEGPVSGHLGQALSQQSFWQIIFGQVLRQPASDWTAENLFADFLQQFAASDGSEQASLLVFWRDVIRLKNSPYSLLKAVLDRHPELLKVLENRIVPEKPTSGDGSKADHEPLEIPRIEHGAEKPEIPSQPLTDDALPNTGQVDLTSLNEDQTLRQSTEENPAQTPRAEIQPEEVSKYPLSSDPVKESRPSQTEQGSAFNEREETSPPTDWQQPTRAPAEGQESTQAVRSPKPVQPTDVYTRPVRTGDFRYVPNAGIVLLHPFLSPLFKTFGLLENRDFINEAAQHKAVHLLHFLATGQTHAPEYDLVLPRFLCGIPFDVPLERFLDITTEEQVEAEKLLQAAINHWNKLGNTSPDGLREGFLQRDGKLEKRESGWCLGVEQKTIDILLDFLPWNLSIIKLPWMPELLRVEWA